MGIKRNLFIKLKVELRRCMDMDVDMDVDMRCEGVGKSCK